ncbi:MAG: RHS repeat-associated core domain-containing protein, partial [Candidatus Izemoplasmatales bacterium]|nr:RHS repeat-associated core domain-containing protein [Candidatus Izemoplasmatales bacterium]
MFRKIVTVLLCLFMVAGSVIPQNNQIVYGFDSYDDNVSGNSADTVNYPTTTDSNFDASKIAIESEIISERTANTKTFRKVDGSYEVAIYNDVIHYYEDGQWKEVDNSLIDDGDSLENTANLFKLKFPKSLDDEKQIKLTFGDYSVDWNLLDIKSSTIDYDDSELTRTNIKEVVNTSQSIIYTNIQNNVDVEYIVSGSQVKENIILNRYIENFSMTFEYKLKNLSLKEDYEGNIVFINDENEVVFTFIDFFMFDNKTNESNSIEYQLIETGNKTYEITIIPDDKWLSTACYPVTIDPSIVLETNNTNIRDKYVYGTSGSSSTANYIKVGYDGTYKYRSYIEFAIDTLPEDVIINYAHLQLNLYTHYVVNTTQISARMVNQTSSFDSISGQYLTDVNDEIIDYFYVLPYGGSNEEYILNVTKAIYSWYEDGVSDGVIELRTEDESVTDYAYFDSLEYSTVTGPRLTIGYTNSEGIKDYWTYSSQQVGEYSTGYVSDYTGLLSVVRNDLSFETERQTLSLSFGYNILDRDTNIGYGSGWNIIYNSYVKYDSNLGLYYTVDYTGNMVYYHSITCDSRFETSYPGVNYCYIAEDGSGDILVRQYGYGYFGGQFIQTPDNIRQIYNTSGYLTSIRNEETNQSIYITRDGTNPDRVTKIKDMSNNEINITYNSYGISTAILSVYQDSSYSHELEKIVYTYEYVSDYNIYSQSTIYHYKDYDNNDSFSLDDYLYYDYDNNGRVERIYMSGQDKVEYFYNTTTSQVTKIKSSYNGAYFSEIDYTYNLKETIITDQNDDFLIYKFDDFGHTVNILDSDGTAQYYKYLNIFSSEDTNGVEYLIIDGEPNYKINHALVSQSNPQSNLFNPINNHGFEYDSSCMDISWVYVDDYGELRELDKDDHSDDKSLYGNYSAKLRGYSSDYGRFEQTIILDSGAYTLTGYVLNEASNSNVWLDVDGEDYGGSITYVSNDGEWTKVTITFGVYTDDTEITVSLVNHSVGLAYFDNIEIYEGFIDNRTNMIDNASFEMTGTIEDLPGWFLSDLSYVSRVNTEILNNDYFESILGDYAVEIEGSGLETRSAVTSISDFLDTSVLEEQGQLVVGAWTLSDGTPTTITSDNYIYGNDRFLRVRIDFVDSVTYIYGPTYESTIIKSEYIVFDTSVEGWQYQYAEVTMPDENTYWINVFMEYKGEGSVYFDGLQIFYENSYTNYEYDEYGNLTAIQTSSGDRTEYQYDELKDYASTPTEIDLPDDTTVELSENTSSLIDEVTYNNVSSSPTYNSYGQVTQMSIGDETTYFTTSTAYTHFSQYTLTKTDEFSNTTDYYNDTLNGLLEAIENAKGQDTHYIYDSEGKLIKVVSCDDYENYSAGEEDALVEYMYDSKDRLWKIVLDDDYYYEIGYDNQGRISQISVNTTPLMSYTYEMDGTFYTDRLSEQTYGNGDVLKFTYNDKDQIENIQFKESGGSFVTRFSYEYDDFGRIAVYNLFENGSIVASEYYTYDSSGNLIQAVDEEGNIIKYIYDDSGNLTSLYFEIDGNESTTNYSYNECFEYSGDVCIQTSSLYDNTEYTTQSNLDVLKDYHYEDDALYRLEYINLTWSTFNIQQNFVYSGDTTRIYEITYEINGTGIDYKYRYYYDSLGNITKEYYYEGTTVKLYRNYEYDELNQLIVEDSRDYSYGTSTLSDTNFTKYYYYDSRGNRTDVKTFLYDQNDLTNPTIPSFYLNNSGNFDAVMFYNGLKDYQDIYSLNVGETPSLTFVYYDFLDVQHEFPLTGMSIELTYNNLDTSIEGYYYRIYHATYGDYDLTFKIVFEVGNPEPYNTIPQEHIHYNFSSTWEDQLFSYGEIEYINGIPQTEATIQEYTYDSQGNPTEITNFVYNGVTYDYAILAWSGRELTNIYVMSSSGYPVYRIEYTYNDQGYRIQKEFSTFNGSGFTINQTIDYELIDDKVVYETDGSYGILYTYDYDGTLISFNYDSDISDQNSGSEYFYIRNQMGDITHIATSDGTVVVHYIYDAYGQIIDTEITAGYSAIADANPYRYRGYLFDSEISMYYLNSRYYNPEVGRFINADGKVGALGKLNDVNLFAYCANNPINNIDPNGYKFKFGNILKAVATVAIVVTLTVAAVTVGGPVLVDAAIGAAVGSIVGAGIGYSKNGIDGAINGALIGAGAGAAIGAAIGACYGLATGKELIGSSGRVFWSGIGPEKAAECATQVSGKTLEQTFIGKVLTKVGYNKITAPLWKIASAGYAMGARGTTYVFRTAT